MVYCLKSSVKRTLFFVGRSLLVFIAVLVLLACVFFWFLNASNIFILVNDGLERRAEYILYANNPDKLDESELYEYFSPDCIYNDEQINNSPYLNVSVSAYDYSIRFRSVKTWPWADEATVVIEELVSNISGSVSESEGRADTPKDVPQWEAKKYEITMKKNESGRWYIADLNDTGAASLPALPRETSSSSPVTQTQ